MNRFIHSLFLGLAIGLAVFFHTWAARADEEGVTWREAPFEWRIMLTPGLRVGEVRELNERMKDAGYDEYDPVFGNGGLSFIGAWRRWMFGAEWGRFSQAGNAADRDAWETSLEGNYWLAQFGYALVWKKGWQFYPLFGLGGGNTFLLLHRPDAEADFDDVLAQPARVSSLSASFFMLDLSLAFDYRFSFFAFGNDRLAHGLVLGARLGYSYSPASWGVDLEGAEISDAPFLGQTGPSFKIVLGWGGGANQRRP